MKARRIVAVVLAAAMLAVPAGEVHMPGNPVTVEAAKKKTAKKATKATVKVATALSVFCGKQVSLPVTGAVKYTSSNSKVATVTSKGLITGKKAGKATITVRTKKKTYKTKVTVKKTAAKINIAENAFKLTMGEKKALNASSEVKLYYKVNNKNARVDSKGNVTALKKGTSYITVSGKASGAYSAPKAVKVKVTVTEPQIDLQYKGTTSVKVNNSSARYKSANSKIAKVNGNGEITAVKPGKTSVTVTAGKWSKKYNITVVKAQSTIQMLSTAAKVSVGDTTNLGATCEVGIRYTSNNESVATVDSKGNVTAKHAGTATIQITGSGTAYYNAPATVNVLVTVPEPEDERREALQNSTNMYTGPKTPQAFLKVCDAVAKTIKYDGNWIYSNSKTVRSFNGARSQARRTNCAHYVSLCMQQFGTLPLNYTFYSYDDTKLHFLPNHLPSEKVVRAAFDKYYQVIEVNGKNVSEIDLQPGDICCYKGHVNVYAGTNNAGVRTWYDFASSGTSDKKPDSGYFVRVLKEGNSTMKVYTILRLK